MKSSKIVKTHLSRSLSNKMLLQGQSALKSVTQQSLNNSRDSSLDNSKIKKRENLNLTNSTSSFIRPKPSNHPLKISNTQHPGLNVSENSQTCQEFLTIQEIVSKFTLKSIETMKQDYNNYEVIYTQFLGIMSEIDEIFEKNTLLQFSFSRAREVFKLYLSRPGQVLLTLKSLPKVLGRIKISQKILSQSALALKYTDMCKVKGIAKDVFELVSAVVNEKKSNFKGKVFLHRQNNHGRLKTYENLITEEKTFDISIMDLNTVPNESEYRSTSPVQTLDSEESSEFSQRVIFNKNKNSVKSKLIEQLYLKLNALPDQHNLDQPFRLATFGNRDQEEIEPEVTEKKKMKTNRSTPGYMRALRRDESEKRANLNSKENKENSQREEWEEKRKVIKK